MTDPRHSQATGATTRKGYEALLRRITDHHGELTPLGERIAEDEYSGDWDEEEEREPEPCTESRYS